MDSHESAKIEDLVAEALARIEEEGPSAAEAIYREHPESADALRVRLEWLLETGLVDAAQPEATEHPERLGDFRLIEAIGKGGMGVVYRAEQLSLGREVALKLVRPENLFFPGARERFQREVTTVAALAHPGIVPVFAVGEEEGVPYFAMEHVRGASIADVLRDLDGRETRTLDGSDLLASLDRLGADTSEEASSLFDGPWPTVCARICREAAEALEHAHRRGVLHRDVKPSNVMLTRGGRVMLVDFGLSSHSTGDERRTRTGHAVGTLAYMAPEQLRAERELDARVDVFALGITLYEMLSLRLPHDGSSGSTRLATADAPIPADLRRVDGRVPWELETVIQTASDPVPARRYASASDLARDLDNVLQNRPIEARRAGLLLRGRRWMQRHPAAALALFVVLAGPTIFAVQELRANTALSIKSDELADSNIALQGALDEATHQREAARSAQTRAEQNFERAYEAIEVMLSSVGGEALEGVPRMEPIRRALLREALRLQEEMLAGPEEGLPQQRLHALTLQRAAALRAEMGELEPALGRLDEAAGVLDGLLELDTDAALERQRGEVDYRRAEVSKYLGRDDLALEHARRAVTRLERLAESDESPETLGAIAAARNELADILQRAGRTDDSRDQLQGSIDALADLAGDGGATWAQRRALAKSLQLMAGYPEQSLIGQTTVNASGAQPYDPVRGETFLRDALELRQQLVMERPDDNAVLGNLADTAQQLGGTLASQMRFVDSEEAYLTALGAYERLVDAFPARPVYADGLASTRYNLSLIASALGKPDERIVLLRDAVAGFEGLFASSPSNPIQLQLALAQGQLGHALAVSNQAPEEAKICLQRSFELGLPLWENKQNPSLRTALVWSAGVLANLLNQTGNPSAAVDAAHLYLDLDPRPIEVAWLAGSMASAISVGRRTGLGQESIAAWTDEAVGLLETLVDAGAEHPEVRRELGEPEFAALAGDPRFQSVLEAFGIGR